MNKNIGKLVKSCMEKVKTMSIATAHDNKPWAATVFYAYDGKFNLYFLSRYYRRHSKNIGINSDVAGTITKQHSTFGSPVTGLQFGGRAKMLRGAELTKAYGIFTKRFPIAKEVLGSPEILESKKQPVRLYKISVKKLILHDEIHFQKEKRRVVVR